MPYVVVVTCFFKLNSSLMSPEWLGRGQGAKGQGGQESQEPPGPDQQGAYNQYLLTQISLYLISNIQWSNVSTYTKKPRHTFKHKSVNHVTMR